MGILSGSIGLGLFYYYYSSSLVVNVVADLADRVVG